MAIKAAKKKTSKGIAEMVNRKFEIAKDANAAAHQRCLDCLRTLDGEISTSQDDDTPDEMMVSMNITLPLTEQVHSLMIDVLDPIKAQPFTLEPAPIAELPDDVEDELSASIRDNIAGIVSLAGESGSSVESLLAHMYQTTLKYNQDEAAKRADSLTTVITDRLKKSDFESEFDDFLRNFIVCPAAFLKGPVSVIAKTKRWDGYGMVVSDELVQKVYSVNPFDIFPAPHARDLNTCDYVIERSRFTSNDILDMVGAPGFDAESIYYVMDNKDSHIIPYAVGYGDDSPDLDPDTDDPRKDHYGYFDVIIFYGKISGRELSSYGVDIEDDRRRYEAEVWVIDDMVIKAVLNNDHLGNRPFYHCSMYQRSGELWGRSVVEVIRDAQAQCTAAGRALVRNMGFSSGPMGEVETDRVLGDDDPTEIYPMMMKPVKAGPNGNPAYRFFSTPSMATELIGVYDKFSQIAYQLVGIPNIAFGNIQGASTLGRTSGGISMMLNQASKPVKKAMKRIESRVIEPLIQAFVDHELTYGRDDTIKGDVNVAATGIRGLQEKEQKEGKLEWALQSLAPYANGVSIPPEYMIRLLEKVLESNGISTDGLPDFALQDALQRDFGSAGLPGLASEAQPTPAQPGDTDFTAPLDGRSQTAIDTINGDE